MVLPASETPNKNVEPECVWFSLVHNPNGRLAFARSPEHKGIADLHQIEEKLRAFVEDKDVHLVGLVKGRHFKVTSIKEGTPDDLATLSDDDFAMLCSAMDLPYENYVGLTSN